MTIACVSQTACSFWLTLLWSLDLAEKTLLILIRQPGPIGPHCVLPVSRCRCFMSEALQIGNKIRAGGSRCSQDEGGPTIIMNIEISLEQVNFVVAWLMALLIILKTRHDRWRGRRWETEGNPLIRISPSRPISLHQYLQSPDTDTEQSETNSTNISAHCSHV